MGGQGFWVEAEAEGDVPSPGVHGGTGLWAEVSAGRERLILGLRSLSLGGGGTHRQGKATWARCGVWREQQSPGSPLAATLPPTASFTSAQTSRFLLWLKPISRPDFAAELG